MLFQPREPPVSSRQARSARRDQTYPPRLLAARLRPGGKDCDSVAPAHVSTRRSSSLVHRRPAARPVHTKVSFVAFMDARQPGRCEAGIHSARSGQATSRNSDFASRQHGWRVEVGSATRLSSPHIGVERPARAKLGQVGPTIVQLSSYLGAEAGKAPDTADRPARANRETYLAALLRGAVR